MNDNVARGEDQSIHEIRASRKRDVALGYRLFAANNWGDLGDGHISARDPEHTDCFWLLWDSAAKCTMVSSLPSTSKVWVVLYAREVRPVAGVGQRVDHHNTIVRILACPVDDKIGANETCSTGDQQTTHKSPHPSGSRHVYPFQTAAVSARRATASRCQYPHRPSAAYVRVPVQSNRCNGR